MSSSDYWPGMTPLTVREITYDEWIGYALTFDATSESRRKQAAQMRAQQGRRR